MRLKRRVKEGKLSERGARGAGKGGSSSPTPAETRQQSGEGDKKGIRTTGGERGKRQRNGHPRETTHRERTDRIPANVFQEVP